MINIYSKPQPNNFSVSAAPVYPGAQIDQRPAAVPDNKDALRNAQEMAVARESSRNINTSFNNPAINSSPVMLNRMSSGAINPNVSSFDFGNNSPPKYTPFVQSSLSPNQPIQFFPTKEMEQANKPIHLQIDPNSSPINIPAHHGKSLRSIQLFENPNNAPFTQIHHAQVNPTVKANLYDPLPVRQPVKLNIHTDSCYNYMNKRRYMLPDPEQTPLEKFFLRESIGQYKVAKILNRTSSRSLTRPKPFLQRRKKYLLVLDIDETLVHSELIIEQSREKPAINKKYDRRVEFRNPNGTVDVYGVRYRPFLLEFLERMSKLYDLAVYTASAQDYADAVIDQLDPSKTLFVGRLYREHCRNITGMNVKNMLNFDGTDVFLVDNLIYSYALQLDQGIPICPFIDDEMDVELKDLAEILENLPAFDSLQSLLQDLLGLNQFYDKLELDGETSNIQVNAALLQHAAAVAMNERTAAGNALTF